MNQGGETKVMSDEREWVEKVKADIEGELAGEGISVLTGYRLPYALHVPSYRGTPGKSSSDPLPKSRGYQTDLLIAEQFEGGWMPRVVVEFKLRSVTTHDALTYSAKAATHKNVHPYLRYGIIIGAYEKAFPKRLIWHGHHFDFMATFASEQLQAADLDRLNQLLKEEVHASRTMSTLLSRNSDMWLLHRKLEISPPV